MEPDENKNQEEVPKGQLFMDNLLWLMLLSLLLSFVIYNGWGLLELINVPPALP